MGKSSVKGGNTKKEAGNAKKAAAAAEKAAKDQAVKDAAEDAKWDQGAKNSSKKADAEAKKADAARKKAEREAQLAAENEGARATPKGANQKTAQKKTKGLDLSQLDEPGSSKPQSALNATGIDNALDALSLTTGTDNLKIDRHPERRFKAAYAAFEERRLPEIEKENPGLRRQQRIEICKKEFDKSEDNPFNQVAGRYDMSKEEMAQMRSSERIKLETRLSGN